MISRQTLVAYLFVLPACGLIGLFIFWPAASMTYTSFHRQKLTSSETGAYCGGENFRLLLSDTDFRQAVGNTILFTVLVVPIQTALALLLAVWVNQRAWSARLLRLAVFIPTTISLVVLCILWRLLYEPSVATGAGLFNGVLSRLGLPVQPFLASPNQAMICIVVMSVWQGVGFQMLIFLSGLQTIPRQRYEAAALDGATSIRAFRHVTLPGLAPTSVVVIMVTTIFALKLFVQPYVMTGGGPQRSTLSAVQYVYESAFLEWDLGKACAAGLLFFVAVTGLTVLQRILLRKAEVFA